jgi:DNA replication terminus site-binding protein
MKSNYHQLQDMLYEFSELISAYVLAQEVYQLPIVKLADAKEEQNYIKIIQTHSGDEKGLLFLKKAFTTLELDALTYSTYLAHRYPGFVVLPEEIRVETQSYINEINRRKGEFHQSVKQDYKKRQSAHENLHKNIENVILLTAVRQIRCCSLPISNINFYWQHKLIQKAISPEQAKKALENGKKNQSFEFVWTEKDDKLAMIEQEIEQLSHIPKNHRIMEIRQTRAQPFVDLWTRNVAGKANKKISSTNASLPMILFGEPTMTVNPLTDYSRSNVKFKEVSHPLINTRKSWYAVPDPNMK